MEEFLIQIFLRSGRKNNSNSHYQNCHKQKGFGDNWWYWASEKKDSANSWGVNFEYGNGEYWNSKLDKGYTFVCEVEETR